MAGVKANDEARLLLDFFRHRDGRDVVDRWVQSREILEGNFGSAVRWCQDGASCKQARAFSDVFGRQSRTSTKDLNYIPY